MTTKEEFAKKSIGRKQSVMAPDAELEPVEGSVMAREIPKEKPEQDVSAQIVAAVQGKDDESPVKADESPVKADESPVKDDGASLLKECAGTDYANVAGGVGLLDGVKLGSIHDAISRLDAIRQAYRNNLIQELQGIHQQLKLMNGISLMDVLSGKSEVEQKKLVALLIQRVSQ